MKCIFVKTQFCGRYVLSRRIRKQMFKQTLGKSGKPHIFMYFSSTVHRSSSKVRNSTLKTIENSLQESEIPTSNPGSKKRKYNAILTQNSVRATLSLTKWTEIISWWLHCSCNTEFGAYKTLALLSLFKVGLTFFALKMTLEK